MKPIKMLRINMLSRCGATVLLVTLPVLGEAAPSSTTKADDGTLDEIIVTARKVRENQQDTPVAVTAFGEAALQDHQVFDTSTLTQIVPNLQFGTNAPLAGNNSSSQVFIRGIGQTDPTSTVDPGVALYIDDVYVGNAVGGRMDLRDIGSVQVLRGPQGTLFGRNTIGGAVLVSTNDTENRFGGTLRGTVGSSKLLDGLATMNIPLADTLQARFSVGKRKQDGYVYRTDGTDLGDTNTLTATSKLRWKPSDKFEAKWLLDYSNSDEHGTPLVFAAINQAATFPRVASFDAGCPGMASNAVPVPSIPDDRCANAYQNRGPFHNNGTAPLKSLTETWGTSINLAYDVTDALTFKSISAYRHIRWDGARDADNTPLTILNTFYNVHGWQWSQELQALYQSRAVTGVVGLYYFKQHSNDIVTIELNTPAPGIQHDSDNNVADNKSWAAFTQWTYKAGERFGATVGARYTHDDKDSYPDQYDFSTPNIKQVPLQWYQDTFTKFTPSASINFRFNKQAMTYLSYSEGFKGGGWNTHFNSNLTEAQRLPIHEFKPETVKSIELGSKLDLFGRTVRLNVAIFDSSYTDMQVTYRGPAPNGVAPFITNAGKASIKGGELEFTWLPTADFNIEASLGYLDSKIDELINAPGATVPPGLAVGNKLPFAPEWQTHLGLSHTFHSASINMTPRVDASYQSATYFDAINTREISQNGGYTIYNGTFVVAPDAGSWRLTFGVKNAGNKLYRIAGNSSLTTGSGYAEVAYARPREYYGTIGYSF